MAERDADVTDAAVAGVDPDAPPGFESILPDYPVRLTNFEGPLDLLIHLIKKNEVDVYDIPIALISQQYLEYLDLMREINLDVAGEFLVMAATLIHIKSRMLVPRVEAGAEADAEEEDPREALVQRLLEHQRFKAAAEMLHECETVRSAQWTRPDERVDEIAGAPFERELEVDLFSLLQAFQAVLARSRDRRNSVPLPADVVSIEARMEDMLGRLAQGGPCGFDDLFADVSSRQEIIVTFLATLELIRTRLIRVLQARVCGPIRIYLSEPAAAEAAGGPAHAGGQANDDVGEEPG
ncbi:MAG: segregation/condensation protein A [Acidobacteria bacterium]|nr:segregation/condensation protein A [Acidobacteriota bacterium]